ncbi:MAG: Na+/H+ antiporter subunit E [Bacteroidales bacterium]|nr:Na+/H+ antiporter subunit E [Bacteroidales bacterium]
MKYVVFFVILMIFWLALTFSVSLANIMVGATASLITVLLFGRYFVGDIGKLFQPVRYFWLLVFLFVFIWECLKANFDVAYRVLHPKMPIKPGIVKVNLGLRSDIARAILANSITMTPGTISVDLIGDVLYVHWIYVGSFDPAVYEHKVAGRFEKYIKRIFD